ncbi:hypothetical protein A2U01_0075370, partial [Trifolium medium]|nr:hypothetical protein [Trifolium medium]
GCPDAIVSTGIVWWGSDSASVSDSIFTIPTMVVSMPMWTILFFLV